MLYLLNDDILSVEKLQSVSGSELYRICPVFLKYIERRETSVSIPPETEHLDRTN